MDTAGYPPMDTVGYPPMDTAGNLPMHTAGYPPMDTAGYPLMDTAGYPMILIQVLVDSLTITFNGTISLKAAVNSCFLFFCLIPNVLFVFT